MSMSAVISHFHIRPSIQTILGRRSPGRRPLGSRDVEDGTDAQEKTPEDGPQLGDQVILHHFTELGVVAGSMGLELDNREKLAPPFSQVKYVPFICI